MADYQVTARKWRPQDFNQVIGQQHVTTALTNAINSGKIPHAYLFSGPRGVGKTSTARILAKLLNCIHSPNICGECTACQEISTGQSLDVREIDGASNRGIEQIREIRDNAIYTPLSLKYKIFIIDEVHMLTKEASNALLKVLEEPPSHVIFMLATTEPNKVLATIRSRCQHYLLKRIPLATIVDRLKEILDNEGYQYELPALEEIARAGDGSMRDSQTILDQVILYSEGHLTLQAVRDVLGLPEDIHFENIINALDRQDITSILEQLHSYLSEVGDGISFAENLTKFLRKALLIKTLPANHLLLDMSQEHYQHINQLLNNFTDKNILTLLNLSLDLCDILRKETAERFWIESTLFKMFDFRNRVSYSELKMEIAKMISNNKITTNPMRSSHITTPEPSPSSQGILGRKLQERENHKQTIQQAIPQKDTENIKKNPSSNNQPTNIIPQTLPKTESQTTKPLQEESQEGSVESVIRNLFETM